MPAALRQGSTAVITGAASGVGFATAKLLREKGLNLALVDLDTTSLNKAKDVLVGLNSSLKTEIYAMDVTDKAAWADLVKKVTGTFGDVDLLILNAGKSFKAAGQQEGGRLKAWEDLDYWNKVQCPFFPRLFISTALSNTDTIIEDSEHQRLWLPERNCRLPSYPDLIGEQITKVHRPYRIQTGNHQPSRRS